MGRVLGVEVETGGGVSGEDFLLVVIEVAEAGDPGGGECS